MVVREVNNPVFYFTVGLKEGEKEGFTMVGSSGLSTEEWRTNGEEG